MLIKICKECKKEFITTDTNNKKIYCSEQCRKKAEQRRNYLKYKDMRNDKQQLHNKYLKYKKKYREETYIELINKKLLTDCIICGFPKEKIAAIHFHHMDTDNKKNIISYLISIKSKKQELFDELNKCVCMCANCHMLYHANDIDVINKYNDAVEAAKNLRNKYLSIKEL